MPHSWKLSLLSLLGLSILSFPSFAQDLPKLEKKELLELATLMSMPYGGREGNEKPLIEPSVLRKQLNQLQATEGAMGRLHLKFDAALEQLANVHELRVMSVPAAPNTLLPTGFHRLENNLSARNSIPFQGGMIRPFLIKSEAKANLAMNTGWQELLAYADIYSGRESLKSPILWKVVETSSPSQIRLIAKNITSKDLTHVTLGIQSTLSKPTRLHFVHVSLWKKEETIEFPGQLLDTFSSLKKTERIQDCLRTTLQADELSSTLQDWDLFASSRDTEKSSSDDARVAYLFSQDSKRQARKFWDSLPEKMLLAGKTFEQVNIGGIKGEVNYPTEMAITKRDQDQFEGEIAFISIIANPLNKKETVRISRATVTGKIDQDAVITFVSKKSLEGKPNVGTEYRGTLNRDGSITDGSWEFKPNKLKGSFFVIVQTIKSSK